MGKLQIKKVGVLSYAKMLAVIGFAVGLIVGILYFLMFVLLGALLFGSGAKGGGAMGGGSVIYGIIALIACPIIYTAIGFIGGAIGALIYNLVSGFIGGIEIEVENVY